MKQFYCILCLCLLSSRLQGLQGMDLSQERLDIENDTPLSSSEDYDNHPQYSFAYDIRDSLTGDDKRQEEKRDGGLVQGQYSLIDPDGTRRIVEYIADDISGFNAIVSKQALDDSRIRLPTASSLSSSSSSTSSSSRYNSVEALQAQLQAQSIAEAKKQAAAYANAQALAEAELKAQVKMQADNIAELQSQAETQARLQAEAHSQLQAQQFMEQLQQQQQLQRQLQRQQQQQISRNQLQQQLQQHQQEQLRSQLEQSRESLYNENALLITQSQSLPSKILGHSVQTAVVSHPPTLLSRLSPNLLTQQRELSALKDFREGNARLSIERTIHTPIFISQPASATVQAQLIHSPLLLDATSSLSGLRGSLISAKIASNIRTSGGGNIILGDTSNHFFTNGNEHLLSEYGSSSEPTEGLHGRQAKLHILDGDNKIENSMLSNPNDDSVNSNGSNDNDSGLSAEGSQLTSTGGTEIRDQQQNDNILKIGNLRHSARRLHNILNSDTSGRGGKNGINNNGNGNNRNGNGNSSNGDNDNTNTNNNKKSQW